ncbi:MAG: alpha/beta hydrolase [Clostridium sp.]|uniref:alpha/beta fold hydrolase n=1 Tax=Clostridium sp. TaxID=1506 RepID=UPI0025C478CD|nr:alpha/beta hydrolase [Clostridium sp.]MCH3963508.1 alpha/beta hydrolase [Clostridium sp.]MCI1714649.1 alpha/beta hydrolase [Clostridium sp.]MCI1799162.1 alpha/beta hydrolase [Clostridium sp.]MCI1812832.1 alpha/beta hydrolase [Clostridium sp.]MCI1869722.1 alpha/beta hydrolase [Clostridium sp.]
MFKKYTGNEQFDLQITRFTYDYENDPRVKEDLKQIVPKLKDFDSWYENWSHLAVKRENEGSYGIASNYYKAAEFYLQPKNPSKQKMYEGYRRNFYKYYNDFDFKSYKVPYENSFLPAVELFNLNAHKTLIIFGGYDSYMEEIIKEAVFLKNTDYNIIVFDGPGQGTALKNGLKFIPNWEKPVSTVIDYFNLKRVSAIGMSWGGYFVLRAAAFEKRIDKVIAFDIFYSGLDPLMNRIPKEIGNNLVKLFKNNKFNEFNNFINKMMQGNIDLTWKINKGYEITGEATPFNLYRNFKRHSIKGIGQFINQEVLLLAGEDDQYVPISRLPQIQQELCNAGSVTTKVFTRKTGGEQHCQVGQINLAFEEIKKFLG